MMTIIRVTTTIIINAKTIPRNGWLWIDLAADPPTRPEPPITNIFVPYYCCYYVYHNNSYYDNSYIVIRLL